LLGLLSCYNPCLWHRIVANMELSDSFEERLAQARLRDEEVARMRCLRMTRTISAYMRYRFRRAKSEELLLAFTAEIDPDKAAVPRCKTTGFLLKYLFTRGPPGDAFGASLHRLNQCFRPQKRDSKPRLRFEQLKVGMCLDQGRILREGKYGFTVDAGVDIAGILPRSRVSANIEKSWLSVGTVVSNLVVVKIDFEKRHFYLELEVLGAAEGHVAIEETSMESLRRRLSSSCLSNDSQYQERESSTDNIEDSSSESPLWSSEEVESAKEDEEEESDSDHDEIGNEDHKQSSTGPPKSFDDLKVGLTVSGRILRRFRHGVTVDVGGPTPGWLPFRKAWRVDSRSLESGRVLRDLVVQEMDFQNREFTLLVGKMTTMDGW